MLLLTAPQQNLPPAPPQQQSQLPEPQYSLQKDLEFEPQPPANASSSGWAGGPAAASLPVRTPLATAPPPQFNPEPPAASPFGRQTAVRASGFKPPVACPSPAPSSQTPGVTLSGAPLPAPKAVGAPAGAPTFLPGLNPKLIAKLKKQGLIEQPGEAEQQPPPPQPAPEAPSRPESGILRFSQQASPPPPAMNSAARASKPVAPPSIPPPVPPAAGQWSPQGAPHSFEQKPPVSTRPNRTPQQQQQQQRPPSTVSPTLNAPNAFVTSAAAAAGGKRSSGLALPSKAPPPPPVSFPAAGSEYPSQRQPAEPAEPANTSGSATHNGKLQQQPYALASSLIAAAAEADHQNETWFFSGTRDEAEAALLARSPLSVSLHSE